MSGIFRNLSNSGVVRFRNLSNSGRALFYGPSTPIGPGGTTTTTTSTTTTTTTGVQVWYTLERCDNLVINYSVNYNSGTFNINDIVTYNNSLYFRVTAVNSSNPGGTQWSVSATGLGSCPTTTTTTTTTTLAPITFTATPSCNGTIAQILVNNFAGGTGTYSWIASGSSEANAFININGGGTRYAITGPSYTFTNLAVNTTFYIVVKDSGGNNSTAAIVTTPTACTTTTTTTTAAPPPSYPRYSVTACPGSSQGATVVSTVSLTIGNVYSGPQGCFTVDSAFGTSTATPVTYTEVTNCSAAQCPQV